MARKKKTFFRGIRGIVHVPQGITRHGKCAWQVRLKGFRPMYVSDKRCGKSSALSLALAVHLLARIDQTRRVELNDWTSTFVQRDSFRRAVHAANDDLFSELKQFAESLVA